MTSKLDKIEEALEHYQMLDDEQVRFFAGFAKHKDFDENSPARKALLLIQELRQSYEAAQNQTQSTRRAYRAAKALHEFVGGGDER